MNKSIVHSIDWKLLGAELAELSDNEQADFFTGFAKELQSYDTHFSREMQMIAVNKKLDKPVKDTLERYLPSLWYKGE